MSSIYGTIQKNKRFFPSLPLKESLPVSQSAAPDRSLRRRLSSLSLKIQPISSPATSWAFRKSKSMSSMGQYAGGSIRKWWDWGWGWIMTKKPTFAQDLEMNEEESALLGFHSKGSWKHVMYKVKAEIRRLVWSNDQKGYAYDSYSYAQNFDDGVKIKKYDN